MWICTIRTASPPEQYIVSNVAASNVGCVCALHTQMLFRNSECNKLKLPPWLITPVGQPMAARSWTLLQSNITVALCTEMIIMDTHSTHISHKYMAIVEKLHFDNFAVAHASGRIANFASSALRLWCSGWICE